MTLKQNLTWAPSHGSPFFANRMWDICKKKVWQESIFFTSRRAFSFPIIQNLNNPNLVETASSKRMKYLVTWLFTRSREEQTQVF